MTKEERQSAILDQLLKQGSVLVSALSDNLQVSAVTIRKDLTDLERQGRLYRSHGKAILINPFTANRSVNEKEKLFPEEKYNIGTAAAQLVMPNDSIVIASGTTVTAFAQCLQHSPRFTAVTSSIKVSEALAANSEIEVIQLGGRLRHSSLSVVGPDGEQTLAGCTFSKLFIGVDGLDLEYGITTTDLREAHLNKVMMGVAQKNIVLADSSKFGRRGFAKICGMDEVDVIITDGNIRPTDRTALEEMGIEVIVVNGGNASVTML